MITLDELERLLAEATPGPWRVSFGSVHLSLAAARCVRRALDTFIDEAEGNILTEPLENAPGET